MNLPQFAVRRPVTICMIVICLLVLGVVSLGKLAIDLLPEMKLPVAVVVADYPGAAPQTVENIVSRPLEESLATVGSVENISSQSNYGSSTVVVQFTWGTDMDVATLEMREKIDLIEGYLPEDVGAPMVFKMDPALMPVIEVGISGGQDSAELAYLAEEVCKPRLERLPGAALVTVSGGRTEEIQVLLDPLKLDSYGVSLSYVNQVLRAENIEFSGGNLLQGKKDCLILISGKFTDLQELREIPLNTSGGGIIHLKDLATITRGYADASHETYINGRPAVGISVLKQSDANTVEVSRLVKEELQAIAKELPGNVQVEVAYDQSDFIEMSINSVTNNALLGGFLAIIVLFLFLRNWRTTLVIGLSIPISIITTFILIFFSGMTLNMLSLGGIALGVGMMVDSSIVVLENIYRYRQEGYSLLEAVTAGAQEVAMAITASTITSIVVFLPIVFVEGLASQIFRDLALAVTFSLLASLLVALTLIPLFSSRLLKVIDEERPTGCRQRINDFLKNALENLHERYKELLTWALGHRRRVLVSALIIFIASLALIPLIGVEFLPSSDSGEISISIEMPRGTALAETKEIAAEVEDICCSFPQVAATFVTAGSSSSLAGSSESDQASLWVKLDDAHKKGETAALVQKIRKQTGEIAGAKIEVKSLDPLTSMMPTEAAIALTLRGPELEELQMNAEKIADIIEDIPGTVDVQTSLEEGRPEVEVKLDRERAAAFGLTTAQAAEALRAAVFGSVAGNLSLGGEEFDIRLRLESWARHDLDDLKNIPLSTPRGYVPLREVAEIQEIEGPQVIKRQDQERICSITADLEGRDLAAVTKDIKKSLATLELPQDYEILYEGDYKEMMRSFGDLTTAFLLGLLLVYAVMASQFESFFHPFVIMFTMPLAFIGVVWGLFITGNTFNITAFVGVIMLAGIVVNNAIVLIDYINTLRERGLSREEAVIQAGPVRLRPVLMTALTTILGMLPLAIGLGEGGEVDAPLAIVVIGGLTVATLLTLVVVPVLYLSLENGLDYLKKTWVSRGMSGGRFS